MYLHNKIVVRNGRTNMTFHNKMLKNATVAIQDFSDYFNYISLGVGDGPTLDTTTGLESFTKSLKLELSEFNIDPSDGELFVTKSVVINEKEDFSFSEAGVSNSPDSSETINRIVLPEPIFYSPGDALSISVTIYLELQKDERSLAFMAGENNFVGLILGHNFNGKQSHQFTACFGHNKAPNDESTVYDKMPNEESSVDIVKDVGIIKFKSVLPTPCGVAETIIGMDGVPVIRYSNYFHPDSSTTTKTLTANADAGMSVRLDDKYIKSVDEVLDKTTNSIVFDFVVEPFGVDLGTVNYSPFGEFDYTKDSVRFLSNDGNAIAFLVDGRLDYYILQYGVLRKMDTSAFVNENLVTLRLHNDIILARYYDESENRHYTKYFYLKNEKLLEGNVTFSFGTEVENKLWNSFCLNICNALNSYIFGFITDVDTYMGYLVRDDNAGTLTGTLYYTIGKPLDTFYVTSGSNLEDAYGAGYKESDDSLGCYVLRSTGQTFFTKSGAKYLLYKYGCEVIANRGYFYATYNDRVLASTCKLLMFCDSLNFSSNVSHYNYVDRAYWSSDGRYLISIENSGVSLKYYTFARAQSTFEKVISDQDVPVSSIDEIVGLSNLILIFRNDGIGVVSVPIIESSAMVSPMRAGDSIQLTYTTTDLVGSSGQIDMEAELRVDI